MPKITNSDQSTSSKDSKTPNQYVTNLMRACHIANLQHTLKTRLIKIQCVEDYETSICDFTKEEILRDVFDFPAWHSKFHAILYSIDTATGVLKYTTSGELQLPEYASNNDKEILKKALDNLLDCLLFQSVDSMILDKFSYIKGLDLVELLVRKYSRVSVKDRYHCFKSYFNSKTCSELTMRSKLFNKYVLKCCSKEEILAFHTLYLLRSEELEAIVFSCTYYPSSRRIFKLCEMMRWLVEVEVEVDQISTTHD